jgi:hypothetical protein
MAYGRIVPAAFVTPVLIAGLLAGCSSSTGPGPVDEIEISLRVSGGIAYREYGYRIAGSSDEIVGLECQSLCDWELGETLASVSSNEIRALATRFISDGFLEVEEEDYGEQCCDQLHYVLAYHDARSDKTVRGSSQAVPEAVNQLAIAVMRFVEEARAHRLVRDASMVSAPLE